jgi:ethanolamine ammonia-lyase small subunit
MNESREPTLASDEPADAWLALRRFTPARIALGRSGDSLPTRAWLQFSLAAAQARDAVRWQIDREQLCAALAPLAPCVCVRSAVDDRTQFLSRPDMGRRLAAASHAELSARCPRPPGVELVVVIADGLSALAVMRHAAPLLRALQPRLARLRLAPLVIAEQARVALGDEIGALWRADLVLVLIGERPGLSSPDSLGAYLTYGPQVGCTDAQRNCVSNIRPQGLDYESAAHKLEFLLRAALRRRCSGVSLKDESERQRLIHAQT